MDGTIIKLHNFDLSDPIDLKSAVKALGGNTKTYFGILAKIEVNSLNKEMERLTSAIASEDLKNVKYALSTLLSAAGYAGAGHVYYACYYMWEPCNANKIQEMLEYYPLLIEVVIDFKRFSRKFLSECKGKVKYCFRNLI